MKNTIIRSLSIIMAVLMLVTCVPLTSLAATHDHDDWGAWTTTEPTCTTAGQKTRKCNLCTTTQTEILPATGHKWATEKSVVKEATCTEKGRKAIVCTVCKAEKEGTNEAIAKTAHQWDSVAEPAFLKAAATCQEKATYYKSCKICKEKSDQFFSHGEKDENNHKKESIEVVGEDKDATCTEKGYVAGKTCKDCKTVIAEAKELPRLSHTPEKPATCKTAQICSVCKGEFGVVDPENHEKIVKDAAVAPTCTEKGKTEGSHCEACGTVPVAQEDIPAKGHDWGVWLYPKGYDCSKGGVATHVCKTCAISESKTIKAGTHNEIIDDAAVEAKCTEEGKTAGKHCEVCGVKIIPQETIPAKGHDKGDVICNNDETHSFKCKRCSESFGTTACTDADSNCKCDVCGYAYNHLFLDYVSNGDATCKADGTETATCTVCGKTDTRTAVDSHLTGAHSYTYEITKPATCVTDAEETGTCSLCGAVDTPHEVPNTRLGHDEGEWILPEGFDCTIGGIKKIFCKRCGAVTKEEVIAAKPHEEKVDMAVPVTCTTDGKTQGSHCDYCGKIIVPQETIFAPGHEAVDGKFVVTKDADCENAGEKEATCKTCNEKFTVEVPKTGHKYAIKIVKPTCTKDGYTEYECTVCNKKYTDNATKATGHKLKKVVTPAQYRKRGSITTTCTACGKKTTTKIFRIETIKLSKNTFVRDGKVHTPTVTIKDYNGKVLKKGTDYNVKYQSGRKAIGTYKVTITFKGNYTGKKVLTFKITPAKVTGLKLTAGKKQVKVAWSKVNYATTYVVYYSTAKNGTYKKAGTTNKLTLNATKLTTGKTYYFKVKAGRETDSGAIVYGPLSAAKAVKVK